MKIFSKNEKGSITLFTLIAMMFFLTIAFTAYASAMAKLQAQNEDLERIKASYEQDLTEEGLATLYEKLTTKVGKYAGEVLKTDANATEPEKKSPYVEYDGNLYRVLYDTSSAYGIELISNSTVGELVELGKNDPAGNGVTGAGELGSNDRAIWSYTNAIETLNKAAEARVNTSDGVVSDVRCVGSRPGNKNFKVTDKYYKSLTPNTNSHFPDEYDGIWEQGEGVFGESEKPKWVIQNEVEDLAKINDLNITTIGEKYWIASRYVLAYLSASTDFRIRYVNDTGSSNNYKALFYVQSSGNFISSYGSVKVRPVLHLAPGVIITGGEGTESSPYTLGL